MVTPASLSSRRSGPCRAAASRNSSEAMYWSPRFCASLSATLSSWVRSRADLHLAGRAFDLGQLFNQSNEISSEQRRVAARLGDQAGDAAAFLAEQREQQVLGLDVLLVVPEREALGLAQRFLQLGGEFVETHGLWLRWGLRPLIQGTGYTRSQWRSFPFGAPRRQPRAAALLGRPVAGGRQPGFPLLPVSLLRDPGGRGISAGRQRLVLSRAPHHRFPRRPARDGPVRRPHPCSRGQLDHLALGLRHADGLPGKGADGAHRRHRPDDGARVRRSGMGVRQRCAVSRRRFPAAAVAADAGARHAVLHRRAADAGAAPRRNARPPLHRAQLRAGLALPRAGLVRGPRQSPPRHRAGSTAGRRARLPQRAFHPAVSGAADLRMPLGDRASDRAPGGACLRPRPGGDDGRLPAAVAAFLAGRVFLLPALVVPSLRGVLHGPAVRAGERGPLHAAGDRRAGRPARRHGGSGPAPAGARPRFPVHATAVPGPHRGARQHPARARAREVVAGDAVLFSRAVAAAAGPRRAALAAAPRFEQREPLFPGAGAGRLVSPAADVPPALLRRVRADPAALPPARRRARAAPGLLRLAAAQAGARRARHRAAAGLPAGSQVRAWARWRRQRRVQPGATRLLGARRGVPQGAGHSPRQPRRRASHPLSHRLPGDRQQLPHHAPARREGRARRRAARRLRRRRLARRALRALHPGEARRQPARP